MIAPYDWVFLAKNKNILDIHRLNYEIIDDLGRMQTLSSQLD